MGSVEAITTVPPPRSASRKLRVIIADDEELCRERLKRLVRAEPGADIVAECATGIEALEAIRQKTPDVAFLDIRMPELDAFAILEALGEERSPAIILVTAFDHFALRAFEIDAVDYLLKPFDRHRFQAAFRRVRERLQGQRFRHDKASGQEQSDLDPERPAPLERLTVRSSGRIMLLKPAEIDWISSCDNYVELHVGNKVHLLRSGITALAGQLARNRFARISRSILVNLDRIQEIRSKSHGDYFVVLSSGVSLTGSRNFRAGLERLLARPQ